ncbi:MAG: Coenzyme F420 hydrogenase/dehydrogenase, beta subunit C-terminal domain [Comamonadaceae bacterium]|nr:Coenzyme F420 hydrogenase/dehydrogenase, beta subunit C-terminal domain [Comamonadaceae bacterium]
MSGKFIDRVLKKEWSDGHIQRYVGNYRSTYLAHASDLEVRRKAASGGVTSALLIHGLHSGVFDGVVVCKTVLIDGKVRARFEIATTADQVLAARGSKYVETRFLREVLPLIRLFEGRVAVVGLPCDISAIRHRCEKELALADKVVMTFALVCGHNSRTGLIDAITSRLEREAGQKIRDYRFRVGQWRGRLEAEFEDGTTISEPSKYFNDYQNLFFFCERKCMTCIDHYGYHADISVGDIWLFSLKNDPIKHSGLIVRSEGGETLYQSALDVGMIRSTNLDIRDIMDGQSRIGPAHYNVSARVRAGQLFGLKLKDTVNEPVTWHAYLNAFITIANMRLTERAWGQKLIFMTPRPLLKMGLYFKKALESLK